MSVPDNVHTSSSSSSSSTDSSAAGVSRDYLTSGELPELLYAPTPNMNTAFVH